MDPVGGLGAIGVFADDGGRAFGVDGGLRVERWSWLRSVGGFDFNGEFDDSLRVHGGRGFGLAGGVDLLMMAWTPKGVWSSIGASEPVKGLWGWTSDSA